MNSKFKEIRGEFFEHLPYTVFSVAAGLVILGFMTCAAMLTAPADASGAANPHFAPAAQVMFHVFHPLHVFFSAVATVAMFWRHERRWLKAILVGTLGATVICGLSDVFLPYLAGWLLGAGDMELHVCIVHRPQTILPFLAAGVLLGLLLPASTHKSTIFSHAAHVLISSVASIMYLVGFGLTNWVDAVGIVFVYMVVAVIVPCCASDIFFPLLLTGKCSGCLAHPRGQEKGENV